jgi:adenylate cyclase
MRNVTRPILVGSVIGLVAGIGFLAGVLDSWGARASDRLFISHPAQSEVVIVAIDDASIGKLGRWPWKRSIHAELIRKLTDAGVRAIGYDVNFPEVSDPAEDTALAQAVKEAGNVVLPIELELNEDEDRLLFTPGKTLSSIPEIGQYAKAAGHSNTPPDADGVVRRIPLHVLSTTDSSGISAFAVEVLRVANKLDHLEHAPVDSLNQIVVNYPNAPYQAFPILSAWDVLRGTRDLSALKGKIVFVGATAADLHDALLVPTSNGTLMPGVEIHASLYDTLSSERWLQPVPILLTFLLLILIGLLVGIIASNLRSRWTIPLLFGLWCGVMVGGLVVFEHGYIPELIWPTITFIFAYAAVTLERRMHSDRARRELKTAFSRYVSASVVEDILKDPNKLKLGGERREMTVLFSDIRGFTSISETMGPEQLVHILNLYLDRMTDLVFQNEGVLDKYIGDAVMAFWNAPLDQADHAVRAVHTAIDMQKALAQMDADKVFGDLDLHIGIGVNSGEMVVGNVGGKARFDYTVIGDNVNLASRLEGLTKEYGVQILVTEATRKDLNGSILLRRLDKVAVKGKKEPVMIYEVLERMTDATTAHQELVKSFERALDAYFARDFRKALEICEEILKTSPQDGPSKTLRERAQHFIEQPPAPDWVGTWVYTKK